MHKKSFWINLSLVNLCIVAFFGFTMRSKILFPIPFIDYRNFMSAHSHFAFGGWVGLCLISLLIFNVLPEALAKKKIYRWILWGIEISSLGMALFFPFQGYSLNSIFFSSLYIIVTYIFAPVFITDLLKSGIHKQVRFLAISAIICLLVSAIGPLGLAYILLSKSGDSILYRDSIYTFLHFQYNGFFTLSIFALFFDQLVRKGYDINRYLRNFAFFLCLSIIPGLALSLLWHGKASYYWIAGAGGVLILISFYYFIRSTLPAKSSALYVYPLARALAIMAFLSFGLKMVLHVGTLIPSLGHAVYGDRPVIIGFLHLVFLAFVSFFILSSLMEQGLFTRAQKLVRFPFIVFALGVITTEGLLMLQGLGILFQTNSYIYNWLLWAASILLFIGALLILAGRLIAGNQIARSEI